MQAGRNGAYGDADTPVRNTSHWLVSFCHAYRLTGEQRLKSAAERSLSYLLQCHAHFPGSVICRNAPGKDFSNGVLGQAHIIEALYYAAIALDSDDAWTAAKALIARHPFNERERCWNRVTPSGKVIGPDFTFNHQLYYAATLALLGQSEGSVRAAVNAFVEGLPATFATRADGRIVHAIPRKPTIRSRLRSALRGRRKSDGDLLSRKEADYHLYNMYAFALLRASDVQFETYLGGAWTKAVEFSEGPVVADRLKQEAWSDGPRSGTETSATDFALYRKAFRSGPDASDLTRALAQLQHFDHPSGTGAPLSPDPVTQRARHYRAWRLLQADPFGR